MEPNPQENPETAENSQASPDTAADASEEKKTEQTEA